MRPDEFAGMSYMGCSAIEWVSSPVAALKLQKTSLSWYLPFVRLRNLKIITFFAGGMPVESQKSPGGPASVARAPPAPVDPPPPVAPDAPAPPSSGPPLEPVPVEPVLAPVVAMPLGPTPE